MLRALINHRKTRRVRLLDLVGKDNYLEYIEQAEGEAGNALRHKLKPGAKCEFNAYRRKPFACFEDYGIICLSNSAGVERMKYIRTNDGAIHEVAKETEKFVYVFANTSEGDCYGDAGYSKEEILKQADDIEELFDYIVCVRNCDDKHFTYVDKMFVSWWMMHDRDYEIYGTIWTKWGLKYVAKLNGKGEWDLL